MSNINEGKDNCHLRWLTPLTAVHRTFSPMSCGSPQGEVIVNRKKVIEIDNIKDLPNEEWREIKGYTRYMVSNMGRIKSLKHA